MTADSSSSTKPAPMYPLQRVQVRSLIIEFLFVFYKKTNFVHVLEEEANVVEITQFKS